MRYQLSLDMATYSKVRNPPIPYSGAIPNGIKEGTQIIVSGTVQPQSDVFSINLEASKSKSQSIVLHVAVRLNDKYIVRNSMLNGAWGEEERSGGCPLEKGKPFEIKILVQHQHYKIFINKGPCFCDYRDRIEQHKVDTLKIQGDIQVDSILIKDSEGRASHPHRRHGDSMGLRAEGILQAASHFGPRAGHTCQLPRPPMYNPPIPLKMNISGGMIPSKMVFISGVPGPNRFTVNIQCSLNGGHNIALHYEARLQSDGEKNVSVLNSCQDGQWGLEEKHSDNFPFLPNVYFDMIIMAEANQFKIAVNSRHLYEFRHRINSFRNIDTLVVTGDVNLTQARIQ